jgi:hypothetical protein
MLSQTTAQQILTEEHAATSSDIPVCTFSIGCEVILGLKINFTLSKKS